MPKKSKNVTNTGGVDNPCKKCNQILGDDNWVCCDACESWVHFLCAGVNQSIADKSWKCGDCLADWDGTDVASKSGVSFNESSVSKSSSRLSQRLQLSLQHLEEQRRLSKLRAEEELQMKQKEEEARLKKLQMEEKAKLKQLDEEQEYLNQRYNLLMQIADEKDASSKRSGISGKSRRTGVSVKSKRDQLEKWLKGAVVSEVGQSKPSSSGNPAALQFHTVSESVQPSAVIGDLQLPTVSLPNSSSRISVPVSASEIIGNVPTLAKSYEQLLSGQGVSTVSSVPASVAERFAPSAPQGRVASSDSCAIIPRLLDGPVGNTYSAAVTLPTVTFVARDTVVSSVPGIVTQGLAGSSGLMSTVYGSHPYYTAAPMASTNAVASGDFVRVNPSQSCFGSVQPPVVPQSSAGLHGNSSFCYPAASAATSTFESSFARVGMADGTRPVPAVGPTSAQLAARQVMPRELPKFNGDPQDWPIFYSSFKNTTEVCGYTDAENLARLQRCLGGSALEAVRSRLLLPASVPYVMDTLHKLYGRPEILISSLLKKVRNVSPPKAENLSTIVAYGLAIQNLVDHIILADQQAHLSNPMLLQELVDKLPTSLKMQWGTFKQGVGYVNLATFNSFMTGLVNLASELTIDVDCAQNQHKQVRMEKIKPREKLFTHANDSSGSVKKEKDTSTERSAVKLCSYCGKDNHQILNCSSFKSLDIGARWKAMRQKNLCRLCLVPHRKWPCHSKKECGMDGCRIRHHHLLHSQSSRSDPVETTKPTEAVQHNYHHTKSYSLFRYLPVTLYGKGNQVEIYAFLDDGSSSTLLEEAIAHQLDIDGEPDTLWLGWTGKIGRQEKSSKRINLKISGAGKQNSFQLSNVRTVRELGLPSQALDYSELSKTYPHLQGLPINSYVDAKPSMIIGIEHVHLLTSLKVREGGRNDPVATKTRLGWCIYGRNSGSEGSVEQLNLHIGQQMSNSDLYDSMKKFFAVEEAVISKPLESEEDQRARSILEATTVRRGSRIESGLLWRKDNIHFPESYKMAMNRLLGLEKRLSRDSELRQRVNEQIDSYEQKQYISKASQEEVDNLDPQRVWYLPLGVVINPKKPGKIRMVWDAAAKSYGVCFNDMLLKGPDLLISLVDVLLRFRQGKVAVCSDIREMFLRILIRDEDRWSQCFLWRNTPEEEVQVYVINVAMFGATSSPCTAQFVKNWNAADYSDQYPRAVEAVTKNHYVDDFLDSVNTVEDAVQLVQQVKEIHAAAGFQFGKIMSNEKEVLHRLGETSSDISKPIPVDKDRTSERVLGVAWIPATDAFTFSHQGLEDVLGTDWAIPTKRQVLRIVMKLYDPLGFVAHFVVHGKILMQEIWRTGTDWDEPVANQLLDLWLRWIEQYRKINEVNVPRCLFKDFWPQKVSDIQIHVFTDASVSACACVAYLRMSVDGDSQCSLIAAKTKVAPLRSLSIPRLELQAAMMGSRLLHNICSALTINIQKRFLWTDSATVLAWLRSDNRRYHQFVSFRVGEILSLTSVDEWRYVPSRENVADDATKWNAGPSFDPDCRWYQGPAFLQDPESQWPTAWSADAAEADVVAEEIRVVAIHRVAQEVVDVQRFSNWNRLLRATAYVHRAVAIWKHSTSKTASVKILSQSEFVKAEETLWRQAQAQTYPEEIQSLRAGQCVAKGSSVRALSPFLDEKGVLRVGGRIEHAPTISYEAKHPVVLPRNHRITYLVVLNFHQRFLHANTETVCNELRQQFYIPRMRTAVRSVCRSCQYCKIRKAAPAAPMMGPLPKVRLTPFIRPFTYIGVDYLGHFEVKVGRSLVKRWICLFTCLTVRAIHLELVHSLSTRSCVMAFRRFVNRRGAPLEVFSDNGTNFVGASRQLSEEIQRIRTINEDCAATFTNARTQWHFNVPATPHMGGPWERMVKSVKVAMAAISDSPHHPSDEVFETIMLEAEGIVNSRPLTYVPLEAVDQEALTPNHFLLYGSSGIKQPTVDQSVSLRDSWSVTRNIVDEFWRRWVLEYLPMLTRRTKWFENVKPLEPGDLVVIIDEQTRNSWERGRILEVFPDKSGQVRRAVVKTARGVFARPAVKLAVLDVTSTAKKPDEVATETEVVHGAGNVTGNTVDRETTVKQLSAPSQLSGCHRVD